MHDRQFENLKICAGGNGSDKMKGIFLTDTYIQIIASELLVLMQEKLLL
jgi:hypothetical protein